MATQNIRESITQEIIGSIQRNDVLPWHRPWSQSVAVEPMKNAVSMKSYQGVNPLILELHRQRFAFTSSVYATWKQWRKLGGQVVRRPDHVSPGTWAAKIVFAKPVKKKGNADGRDEAKRWHLLKRYSVFSADQVVGAERFRSPATERDKDWLDFGPAEKLIAATKAKIFHISDSAAYHVPVPVGSWPHHSDGDFITMPPKHRFDPPGGYYTTMFHELAHWLEPRLSWDREGEGYAMSELVAEIASSYVAAELGVPQSEDIGNHTSYVKGWLDDMKGDSTFIFRAASQASRVADSLLSLVQADQTKGVTT